MTSGTRLASRPAPRARRQLRQQAAASQRAAQRTPRRTKRAERGSCATTSIVLALLEKLYKVATCCLLILRAAIVIFRRSSPLAINAALMFTSCSSLGHTRLLSWPICLVAFVLREGRARPPASPRYKTATGGVSREYGHAIIMLRNRHAPATCLAAPVCRSLLAADDANDANHLPPPPPRGRLSCAARRPGRRSRDAGLIFRRASCCGTSGQRHLSRAATCVCAKCASSHRVNDRLQQVCYQFSLFCAGALLPAPVPVRVRVCHPSAKYVSRLKSSLSHSR